MSTSIVKFESATGQPVQFTAEEVKRQLCPGISDQELAYVMGLCQAQKLNPFTKDVYIVKYGNGPASIITSKEVFSKRANANPNYEGFEAGVTVINGRGEIVQREGSAVYAAANEKLVGGWCRVFVKGRKPYFDEVTMDEYSTGKSGWAKMPATMIRKVAYVHCMREAFPDEFQGLYAAEEMGDSGQVVYAAENSEDRASEGLREPQSAIVATVEFEEVPSDADMAELNDAITRFAELCGKSFADVVGAIRDSRALSECGFPDDPDDMTKEQHERAMGLLGNWIRKAEDAAEKARELEEREDDHLASEDIPF